MVLLSHRHHLVNQRTTQQHSEDGAEIDRQVIPAILGGLTHRAVERPRGAIHPEPKAVHPGILKGVFALAGSAVTQPRDNKEYQHVAQCQPTQLP